MNSLEALNKLRELNKSGDKKVYFDIIEKELKPAISEENGIKYIAKEEGNKVIKNLLGIKEGNFICIHYKEEDCYYKVFDDCIAEVCLDGYTSRFNTDLIWLFGKRYEVLTREEYEKRREKEKKEIEKASKRKGIINIDFN